MLFVVIVALFCKGWARASRDEREGNGERRERERQSWTRRRSEEKIREVKGREEKEWLSRDTTTTTMN